MPNNEGMNIPTAAPMTNARGERDDTVDAAVNAFYARPIFTYDPNTIPTPREGNVRAEGVRLDGMRPHTITFADAPREEYHRIDGRAIRHAPDMEPAEAFKEMLSTIAYLIFKRGGIDAGEYQSLTVLNGLSYHELLAKIIEVSDAPQATPVTGIDPRD